MLRRECLQFVALLTLAGCRRQGREPAIGEGFVAAASLELHQELGASQPVVAVARHGERLEILARRRRFVRVRNASGAVGWTDGDLLFSKDQMESLWAFGRWASQLPPQGHVTVLDPLNVHASPSRTAPSLQRMEEGQNAVVVGHKLVQENGRAEDWSLVVLGEGMAGWALTRRLFMSIPDEVAQYAEGQRIMAYFPLGEVEHKGQVKQNWLWATISKGGQPYEFDGLRLFVWSLRRQRYETAFRTRNLRGYYPIEVFQEPGGGFRFTLVAQEKEGPLSRLEYAFQAQRVRLLSRTPVAEPPRMEPPASAGAGAPEPASPALQRWMRKLADVLRKRPGG